MDSNVDQAGIDETRNVENFVDFDFPALSPSYERRAYAHHRLSLMASNQNPLPEKEAGDLFLLLVACPSITNVFFKSGIS